MSWFELFLTALALSMDAFAAAVCKGLSVKVMRPKHLLLTGLYFGGFQALMPLIGYYLGKQFETFVTSFDHWIAFILLGVIGLNMIRESRSPAEETDCSFSAKSMLPLAIATSIDALAVGITFALLDDIKILPAVGSIGVITFALSALGVKVGNVFGAKYKSRAELIGGIVLIGMGLKILFEHLGIFG